MADLLGPSHLSRILENLKINSPGHLPSLISLKVKIPDAQRTRAFRPFMKSVLPGIYYSNPTCKISFESIALGEPPHITCKFAGRNEESLPLKEGNEPRIIQFLKNLEPRTKTAINHIESHSTATTTASALYTKSGKDMLRRRPDKYAARTKAREAWELSRYLDSI